MDVKDKGMDDTLELMREEINRCKNNEQELYSLDRLRAETMSDIQQKVTKIMTDHEHMQEDLKEFKKELGTVKDKMDLLDNKVDVVETKVDQVTAEIKQVKQFTQTAAEQKQWTPKDYCVVIVAILSLVGTIITALLK